MIDARMQVGLVGRGFVVTWTTAGGESRTAFCANRTQLARLVALEAAPQVRGDPPTLDERFDLHDQPHRRSTDP